MFLSGCLFFDARFCGVQSFDHRYCHVGFANLAFWAGADFLSVDKFTTSMSHTAKRDDTFLLTNTVKN